MVEKRMTHNRNGFIGLVVVGALALASQSLAAPSVSGVPLVIEPAHSYVVPVINDDQLKGNWKQFKGEFKKKWADFTDDDLLYIEGQKDKLEGKIQERYGDNQEEVKKWVDEWFEQHDAQGRDRTK